MTKDEKALSDPFDNGELAIEESTEAFLHMLALAGENTFRKDKRINIRLSYHNLTGIQRKAARKGIPYQSLISGLFHQYDEGDLQGKS